MTVFLYQLIVLLSFIFYTFTFWIVMGQCICLYFVYTNLHLGAVLPVSQNAIYDVVDIVKMETGVHFTTRLPVYRLCLQSSLCTFQVTRQVSWPPHLRSASGLRVPLPRWLRGYGTDLTN